jgi:hypothetical protein
VTAHTAMTLTLVGMALILVGVGMVLAPARRHRAEAPTISATKPRPVAFSNLVVRCSGSGLRPYEGKCPHCDGQVKTDMDYDRGEVVVAEHGV